MIVYLLASPSGKFYVGQTKFNNISKRWNQTLSNVRSNQYLARAIKKHGACNFRRTILCRTTSQKQLDRLERFWIAFTKSDQRKFGYNIMPGGQKWRGVHTDEIKKKISKSNKLGWAKLTPKEKWEFNFSRKIAWLNRTEDERLLIARKITKTLTGKPSKKKGKPSPSSRLPKSPLHRQHISEGLKLHFATLKKPCQSTNRVSVQTPQSTLRIARETRLAVGLKQMAEAKQQLKDARKRLNELEHELKGGCNW